jgi:predicted TPR repeat methyltransferase
LIATCFSRIKNLNPGLSSLVDAGCGDASLLRELSGRHSFQRTAGIDVSDLIVQKNKKISLNTEFYVYDLGQAQVFTSSIKKSFDVVVSSEVIEHVSDDHAYLANLKTLCRDGGYLILTTQSGPLYRMDREILGHLRHYTSHELVSKLNRTGFAVVSIQRFGFPWLSLQKRIVQLSFLAVRRFLKSRNEPSKSILIFLKALSILYRFSVPGFGPQIVLIAKSESRDHV